MPMLFTFTPSLITTMIPTPSRTKATTTPTTAMIPRISLELAPDGAAGIGFTLPILNDSHEPIEIQLRPGRVPGDLDGERRTVKIGSQQFAGIDWLKPGEYTFELSPPKSAPPRVGVIPIPILRELAITRKRAVIEDQSPITIAILVWSGKELLLRELAITDHGGQEPG